MGRSWCARCARWSGPGPRRCRSRSRPATPSSSAPRARARCWSPRRWRSDPGPGRARIVVAAPYAGAGPGGRSSSSPQPVRARGIDPRPGSARAACSGRTSASARSPCWAGACSWGTGSGSPRASPSATGCPSATDSMLGPRVVCYPGTRIGSRVVLKAGAVIGGDGFGYLSGAAGHDRIPHVGGCILEDDVEVGSNSCVDRGSLDDTVIGRGTKLDNLVHVGHNVRIGERCLLMAGVGVAGSTRIGERRDPGGTRRRHRPSPDRRRGPDRGQERRLRRRDAGGASISGHPARPNRQFLRAQAALYRLAPLLTKLERARRARGWLGERWPGRPPSRASACIPASHTTARCLPSAPRARGSGSGGPIFPARPRSRRVSPRSGPPSAGPRWAKSRRRCRRWSICSRRRRRSCLDDLTGRARRPRAADRRRVVSARI